MKTESPHLPPSFRSPNNHDNRRFWWWCGEASGCVPVTPVRAVLLAAAVFLCRTAGAWPAADSALLRYADPPVLARTAAGLEWRASVDCAPPVSLAALIGARVGFALDVDLDGDADATDSLSVSPADCGEDGESGPGRIALRRRVAAGAPAVLRAALVSPAGAPVDSHAVLTHGAGSLLGLPRFCAAPQNGEPEWIEVRNVSTVPVSLARVRLEGRALSGTLQPGEGVVAGGDTAELRLWQPGARLVALSSWTNLRNSGDTLRLKRDDGVILDSVMYTGAEALKGCASGGSEDGAAAASGYALEFSSPRLVYSGSGATPFTLTVRAPADGRYDLLVYDLDGRPLCALARGALGPSVHAAPFTACPALKAFGAGRVIIHLSPRQAPGVRTLLRMVP